MFMQCEYGRPKANVSDYLQYETYIKKLLQDYYRNLEVLSNSLMIGSVHSCVNFFLCHATYMYAHVHKLDPIFLKGIFTRRGGDSLSKARNNLSFGG